MNRLKRRGTRGLLIVGVFLLLFIQGAPSNAYKICQRYGVCTICDFFSERHEWQGSIEWCF